MEELQLSLENLQKKTIGLFITGENSFSFVIAEDEYTFDAVCIGKLGGLFMQIYPKNNFRFIRFSDNKNLYDFARSNGFSKWYTENIL